MGDRHDRAAAAHLLERGADRGLAAGVERGGRFVEHQDVGVAEERAGDRDALSLSAREPSAALAHHRVVAERQVADDVVDLGRLRRGDELGLGRVGLADAQVAPEW